MERRESVAPSRDAARGELVAPERWQEVKALFEACGRQEPAERSAFLDTACAWDQSLRDEVESLLAEAEQAGGFLEQPLIGPHAEVQPATFRMGQSISHYQIAEKLGEGGMGGGSQSGQPSSIAGADSKGESPLRSSRPIWRASSWIFWEVITFENSLTAKFLFSQAQSRTARLTEMAFCRTGPTRFTTLR